MASTKTIRVDQAKSSKFRSRLGKRNNIKRSGGRTYSKGRQPELATIMRATEKLAKKGVANDTFQQTTSTNGAALDLLFSMGCSMDTCKGKGYSLKNDATNTTTIENPNILDTTRISKKKKKQMATDKFSNSNDAFYQLDQNPPAAKTIADTQRKRKRMTPNVVTVASDLAKLNMRNQPSTLPEFR